MRRALSGMLLGMLLLAPSAPTVQALPQGVQVLWYSRNVMERVAQRHMNPAYVARGDYVPTLRLTRAEMGGCLTAVNWQSRGWVGANARLTIDFWHPRAQRWIRKVCRPVDWQRKQDSTGSRQRFELDFETAMQVGAYPYNTTARLVRVDWGK
jgi:hypothetical protein